MNQLSLYRDFSLLEAMGNALNPNPAKPLIPTAKQVNLIVDRDDLIDLMVSEISNRWNRSGSQDGLIDQEIMVDGIKIDIQTEWFIWFEYDDESVRAYDFKFDNDQLFWMDGESVRWNQDVLDQVYPAIEEQVSDELSN